ncbi:MAG: ABC transporter permease subunit [bacterium]|nr:ABC transporter permease subunit [bacterium]
MQKAITGEKKKQTAVRTAGSRQRTKKKLRKYLPLYLLALPGIIYLIINNYLPMGGLILAFKKYSFAKGILDSPWNGLGNFTYLFGSKWAGIMFRNTICYNIVFLILGTVFAIFVAILLGEIRNKAAKQAYQTVILIPHLMSTVLIGYLVFAFLSGTNGFVNKGILEPLGLDPVSWYTEAKYWPFILVIVQLWRSFGFQSIVYFATIIGFDRTYYEAAVVDGASTWQQITRITLPLLKPTVIILTIMSLGRMFASDFGLFYQVPQNSGLLYSTTTTIDTFVYRTLMQDHDVGRSLAAGFLQSVLGFIVVMITNGIVRKVDSESALF